MVQAQISFLFDGDVDPDTCDDIADEP